MPPKKKKGKKKSKKPKISKEEKARLKLEKSCEELTTQLDLYQSFLDRMNRWMKENGMKAEELFRKFDTNQDGLLSYDEFKAGMLDLDAPCNSVELHVFALQLDKDNNGRIDYLEFAKGLTFPDSDQLADGPVLRITKEEIQACPCCQLGLWKPYVEPAPRYVKILFKMATFENLRSYPGHFIKVVHSHIYVYGLISLIKEEMDIATTKMRLYLNKTREASDLLIPDKTMEEYGFRGSTRDCPQEVLLYYDFTTEVQGCPLANCDYYFTS
ncbi:hypothetical protein BSL78_24272 [Apostichopus japonicus]|uniref:EF-hand domain-containing protein n=1 Tax=Stichopus japonicus TaxID=307972 RepID=A0A2G8JT08_STIJA|nr:hypothetical protein BSL78_24272 [Apostichopus japonicus]